MDHFASFVQNLRDDLAGPLPGKDAQYQMAPRPRRGGEIEDEPSVRVRRGGVLLLFYPQNDELYLPFILRPIYSGAHSGQVAFPGGGYETGDGSLTATAVREAYEEIGVEPSHVQILGKLSPIHIHVSNYLVWPIIAWIDRRPPFRIDPYEVARLLEIPLSDLLRPHNRYLEEWSLRDRTAMVPFFKVNDQIIWGATAMILSELLTLDSVMQMAEP